MGDLHKGLRRYVQNMKIKKDSLSRILEIARMQKGFIEEGQADKLYKSMKEREGLLERIDKLDEERSRIREDLEESGMELGPDSEELKKGMLDLLLAIQELDEVNSRQIQDKTEEYRVSLRQLRNSKRGIAGYTRAYTSGSGHFIDTKK